MHMIYAMFFCWSAVGMGSLPCELQEGPFQTAAECEKVRKMFSGDKPDPLNWYQCKGRRVETWENAR